MADNFNEGDGNASAATDGYPETDDMKKRANRKQKRFIDATPNGNYALRILRAYRRDCDMRWEAHPPSVFADMLNDLQEQRAKELDRAIAVLEEAAVSG